MTKRLILVLLALPLTLSACSSSLIDSDGRGETIVIDHSGHSGRVYWQE